MGVKTVRTTAEKINDDAGRILATREFWVLPEFQAPQAARNVPAVADPEASAHLSEWLWAEGNKQETMHPFWAVRRLTAEQLDKEIQEKREASRITGVPFKPPRFNCELKNFEHSAVIIATVGAMVTNCTRIVSVPYLTNKEALVEKDELILQIKSPTMKEKATRKRTWRDVTKT